MHGRHAQILGQIFGQIVDSCFGASFADRKYSFTVPAGRRNTVLHFLSGVENKDKTLCNPQDRLSKPCLMLKLCLFGVFWECIGDFLGCLGNSGRILGVVFGKYKGKLK